MRVLQSSRITPSLTTAGKAVPQTCILHLLLFLHILGDTTDRHELSL